MAEIRLVVMDRCQARLFRLGLYWEVLLNREPANADELLDRLLSLLPCGYRVGDAERARLARQLWGKRLERPELDLSICVDREEEGPRARPTLPDDPARALQECREERGQLEGELSRVRIELEKATREQGRAESLRAQLDSALRRLAEQAARISELEGRASFLEREKKKLEEENRKLRDELIRHTTPKGRPGAR